MTRTSICSIRWQQSLASPPPNLNIDSANHTMRCAWKIPLLSRITCDQNFSKDCSRGVTPRFKNRVFLMENLADLRHLFAPLSVEYMAKLLPTSWPIAPKVLILKGYLKSCKSLLASPQEQHLLPRIVYSPKLYHVVFSTERVKKSSSSFQNSRRLNRESHNFTRMTLQRWNLAKEVGLIAQRSNTFNCQVFDWKRLCFHFPKKVER